ncbi:MAG: glutaredoxin, partial [Chloroflexota bacterium]
SGRGGDIALFREAERAALRLAYLSAQIPLITPRCFVQPVIDQFDTKTCIELFVVCSIASLIQRFAAIIQPAHDQTIAAFVKEHGLSTDTLTMRFPIL